MGNRVFLVICDLLRTFEVIGIKTATKQSAGGFFT